MLTTRRRGTGGYRDTIEQMLARRKAADIQPHWVEGYMRLKYGTLDHLTRQQFSRDVSEAITYIRTVGVDMAEDLARSHGL